MKETGIFYASTTGYTAEAAADIAKAMNVDAKDIHDVSKTAPSAIGDYRTILLGASTWGDGDMETGMRDFVDGAQALDLKGHRLAFFGCGEESFGSTFCAALGQMYDAMRDTGATYIGAFDVDGYDVDHSTAEREGRFPGLALDNVNHPEMAQERISRWIQSLQ